MLIACLVVLACLPAASFAKPSPLELHAACTEQFGYYKVVEASGSGFKLVALSKHDKTGIIISQSTIGESIRVLCAIMSHS
jgi:hypothetical protein